jgi:hypothetical protein
VNDGSSRHVSGSASPHKADVYSQAAVLAAALQAHEDAIGDGGPLRVLHLAVHAYLHVHEGVCTRAGGGWRRGVAAGAVAWELPRLPAIAWCFTDCQGHVGATPSSRWADRRGWARFFPAVLATRPGPSQLSKWTRLGGVCACRGTIAACAYLVLRLGLQAPEEAQGLRLRHPAGRLAASGNSVAGCENL